MRRRTAGLIVAASLLASAAPALGQRATGVSDERVNAALSSVEMTPSGFSRLLDCYAMAGALAFNLGKKVPPDDDALKAALLQRDVFEAAARRMALYGVAIDPAMFQVRARIYTQTIAALPVDERIARTEDRLAAQCAKVN